MNWTMHGIDFRIAVPATTVLIAGMFVSRARTALVEALCQIYVAIAHRPFRGAPIAFLFSDSPQPLPKTDSLIARLWSLATLRLRTRGRKVKPESQINWDSTEYPKNGDLILAWDRVAEWDERCIHPAQLQKLRSLSDPIADQALEQVAALGRTPSSTDKLEQIYAEAANEDAQETEACQRFVSATNRRPPPGSGALSLDWYRIHQRSVDTHSLPSWPPSPDSDSDFPQWNPEFNVGLQATAEELEAEAEVIRRGQDVFYKYAGPMLLTLLHFSLAGGFASPRITEVLRQTAYLVPNSHKSRNHKEQKLNSDPAKLKADPELPTVDKAQADRTWSRLLETTQFVLDVMETPDSLSPPCTISKNAGPSQGGQGWQSAARVRLLHTAVRRRVLKMAESTSSTPELRYNLEQNGVPINQEDLLATLCAFSVAPLASLQRMGISPSRQERHDFIALWRHVGFYMGIEPALLRACFGDPEVADRTLWCSILHLFGEVEIGPKDLNQGVKEASQVRRAQGPTIPVLIACADRPPFHTPLSAHFAIARHLLGDSLADSLGIPATSASRLVITDIAFLGLKIPIIFGQFYRPGWEKTRRQLARPLLRRLIVWSFGNQRTKFEMPAPSHTDEGKVQTQSSNHSQVKEDRQDNLRLARQWSWLMREMVAVLVLSALCSLGTLMATARYAMF